MALQTATSFNQALGTATLELYNDQVLATTYAISPTGVVLLPLADIVTTREDSVRTIDLIENWFSDSRIRLKLPLGTPGEIEWRVKRFPDKVKFWFDVLGVPLSEATYRFNSKTIKWEARPGVTLGLEIFDDWVKHYLAAIKYESQRIP